MRNDPADVPGLRAGSTVEVAEADIFDFSHVYTDGRREGNETGKIMNKRRGGSE